MDEIVNYFESNAQQKKAFLTSIKGDTGSRKTLFARSVVENLIDHEDFCELTKPKESIFCSSLNSETQY